PLTRSASSRRDRSIDAAVLMLDSCRVRQDRAQPALPGLGGGWRGAGRRFAPGRGSRGAVGGEAERAGAAGGERARPPRAGRRRGRVPAAAEAGQAFALRLSALDVLDERVEGVTLVRHLEPSV